MVEIKELDSYVPDNGFLNQSRGVVFHHTFYDSIPWIISRREGIDSLSSSYQKGRPIKSDHMVTVQDKMDRPEWISVYDSDAPLIPWGGLMPLGQLALVVKKQGLSIDSGEAQHKLSGEAWVVDWIPPENIDGVLVQERILKMKMSDFLDRQIGDDRYKKAYERYSRQSRGATRDEQLHRRMLQVRSRVSDDVDAEMPDAYWMIKGEEKQRRMNRAVVVEEWRLEFPELDFEEDTVGDWLKLVAQQNNMKLWKVTRRDDNEQEKEYIERVDKEFS